MQRPDLAIVYETGFPAASFQEFSDAMNGATLTVHLEQRPRSGPMAGLMWMMITSAAVFVGANYFGGIFKEIGKDHYELLKKSLAKLTVKTMGMPRIEPVLVNTSGKVDQTDPFSMAFSIYVELPNDRRLKLLIPKKSDQVDYPEITGAFLDFVERCYDEGEGVLEKSGLDLSQHRTRTLLTFAFNAETKEIEWMDPRPRL